MQAAHWPLTVLLPSHSYTGSSHPSPGHRLHSHQPSLDPGDLLQCPPVLDSSPPAAAQVSDHVAAFQGWHPTGGERWLSACPGQSQGRR